jgi:hypothetical protein
MINSLRYKLSDNAIIYFERGNGIVSFDPDTGNPIEGIEVIEVRASIKQRKLFFEQTQQQVGKDTEIKSVEGTLVKPSVIGLRQIARKKPVRVIVNEQPATLVIDAIIDSPAVTRLKLVGLVGEKFTGKVIYDP